MEIDSIAVSIFVVILVEFDKIKYKYKPETSRLVYIETEEKT